MSFKKLNCVTKSFAHMFLCSFKAEICSRKLIFTYLVVPENVFLRFILKILSSKKINNTFNTDLCEEDKLNILVYKP